MLPFIIQFCLTSCCLLLLRHKCLPQHCIREHTEPTDHVSDSYTKTGKLTFLYIPFLMFLDSNKEARFWTDRQVAEFYPPFIFFFFCHDT
jgi:hypothetical protein